MVEHLLLVLNAGSSSLKYELLDDRERSAARGEVASIGAERAVQTLTLDGRTNRGERACPDHRAALEWALAELDRALPGWPERVAAVGHRIVHGGARLWAPTRVDDEVVAELERQAELAPLHNGPGLAALRAARALRPDVPHVVVFDTGFHHDLPPVAREYALPADLVARWEIRRYGFHGSSCRYVLARAAELGIAPRERAIVCHLGAGASVTAARDGRSVDTSMGFTPLEGLIMGTRSGDLDPALPLFLQRHGGLDAAEVERLLERESGLRALGQRSGDYAELERAAAQGDARADLALELFAYRIRKYLGAYWAALGGVDLIVFTGGIGERSAVVRDRVCERLRFLDPFEVHIVPSREELVIAEGVRRVLRRQA